MPADQRAWGGVAAWGGVPLVVEVPPPDEDVPPVVVVADVPPVVVVAPLDRGVDTPVGVATTLPRNNVDLPLRLGAAAPRTTEWRLLPFGILTLDTPAGGGVSE